jgi:alanine-glyoxylate transaminase/serine-glyoxylate transaminase/serine-pyruvate transaminase
VADRVYQAMAQPIVGHLDPYFFEVSEGVRRGLQLVYGTTNEMTLAMSGTGSAGMETAVSNFVGAGSKLVVLAAGYFADRISEMGRRHGATVIRIEKAWGEPFDMQEVRDVIRRERPQTVAFVHAETSTGVLTDPKPVCEVAHEVGALVIADCVTSLGALPVNVDANGIDIAYSCSQKGMSCPPGLSPFTASARAMEVRQSRGATTVWYLDLNLLSEYFVSKRYHHTAPITSFYALLEGLALVQEEGLEARLARHVRAHHALVAALEARGYQMHVAAGHRIPNLNTVRVPQGVNDLAVRQKLLAEHGIEIAGGFGPLAGKIFRIGLMGPLASEESAASFVDAFDRACRG